MTHKRRSLTIFTGFVSLLFFYLFNRVTLVFERITTGDILEKANAAIDGIIPAITEQPFILGTTKTALFTGAIGGVCVWLFYVYNVFGSKKYMHGIEHGSAEWGTPADIANYTDENLNDNILLTETEKLSMSDRMKRTDTDDFNRNKNVLIIGGSGSGKTRFYIKPNLMQLHSSFVVTDPKGSLIHETGKMLMDSGYKIKVFDLINRDKSDHYNPFEYLKNEDDILKLINNMIANTNAPQSKSAGDFWEKSEIALLEAIFGYILFEAPKADQTIATAMELLRLAEVKEDNEDYQSPLDIIFEDLKEEKPDHFAVKQYDIYKFAAGKTAKSILISVGVRLAPFNIQSIRNIVSGDTIGLDMIGSEKTALFIILPDTDKSFNFLAAMMFQQMFDILVYRADNDYRGKLPFHVRCLMDEFSNIGQIPQLEVLISTIRSRGISLNIVLQNLAQIKNLYKDTWEIITGNCDSLLFLGGMEQSTLDYISKMCGKTTIDNRNTSESRGQTGSYSMQYQIMGRDLITPDEVGGMKGRTCILKIRGCNPFRSQKYNIEKHKNYKLLSDANENNWFDIEQRDVLEDEAFLSNVKEVQVIQLSELNTL
jgi:Type IV secretory pathway, VirD4 components